MRTRIIGTAVLAALVMAACSAQPADTQDTSSSTTTIETTSAVVATPDTAAQAAAEAAEVARVAEEQEAARAAAESSAAAQSAADQAAADQAVQAAADQAEADRVAAEEQAAATTAEQPRGEWIDRNWGWVSPETAQRALDYGIPWGGDVPGFLRCGTICGEQPTSGEVQSEYQSTHVPTPAYPTIPTPDPGSSDICPRPLYLINGQCLSD
jgi:hypothetical protein